MNDRPLLSICIPTYNRARVLEGALRVLIPQVAAAGGAVELVVSDNCSSDETPEVVSRAQALGAVRFHRNEQNVGAAANISRLCDELARGEFAWLLGDDDLVLPGGVERVLSVLRGSPEVDYVFVNCSHKLPSEREFYERIESAQEISELVPAKSKDLSDHHVGRWEELIDPDVDDVFLGAMMCSVFRLSRWRGYALGLGERWDAFDSLERSYPHTVVLAHTMMGRRAYYIGHPCTVHFWGGQEWIGYVPLLVLVRLQDLLELYLSLGVERERVERCRLSLLNNSGDALRIMLKTPGAPGRKFFSLPKFVWRNRHHARRAARVLWDAVGAQALPVPLYRLLRATKRFAKAIRL